jgi:ABC-2 type transport system ATP-binding protein
VISIERCSKGFRQTPVLDGVSLEIGAGERVALVGGNGAGKTTLIRCLLGQYPCDGRILVGGLSPRTARTQVLRRVGFVPQSPPPLRMPVAQLVAFASGLCQSDPGHIAELANRLGLQLEPIARRPFAKLSGGQKQKLLIAIALRSGSDVLVMDEPTANLDPSARRVFLEMLAEREAGSTMLISSHRIEEVAGLVGRVVELDGGHVVLDDRLEDAQSLHSKLECRIQLAPGHESLANALRDFGLGQESDPSRWAGTIAGPDRARFFRLLARHAASWAHVDVREADERGPQ